MGSPRPTCAFTLIEVLVVVAIIALLITILVPSLQRARTMAKITSCKANCKQIATAVSTYRAEEKGYVPIMHNWHATTVYPCPARVSYLSLALRRYEKGLSRIAEIPANSGGTFDPEQCWPMNKRDEYEVRFLPAHYVCPFERGKHPWEWRKVGTLAGKELWEWRGVMDCYHTVLWETVERGVPPEGAGWGDSPLNGVPKYSSLTWNKVTKGEEARQPEFQNKYHRQWSVAEARRVRAGTLSEVTVVYCAIGEHVERGNRWVDHNSHRTSQGGGTDVVFADSHVEWVKGTRIGWP